jgi:hypothetical protein
MGSDADVRCLPAWTNAAARRHPRRSRRTNGTNRDLAEALTEPECHPDMATQELVWGQLRESSNIQLLPCPLVTHSPELQMRCMALRWMAFQSGIRNRGEEEDRWVAWNDDCDRPLPGCPEGCSRLGP